MSSQQGDWIFVVCRACMIGMLTYAKCFWSFFGPTVLLQKLSDFWHRFPGPSFSGFFCVEPNPVQSSFGRKYICWVLSTRTSSAQELSPPFWFRRVGCMRSWPLCGTRRFVSRYPSGAEIKLQNTSIVRIDQIRSNLHFQNKFAECEQRIEKPTQNIPRPTGRRG